MSWKRTTGLGVLTAALAAAGTTVLLAQDAAEPPRVDVAADTDLTLRFTSRVKLGGLNPESVRIRDADGGSAAGELVRGEPLVDAEFGRRVVVRPEAVREYFELVRGLDRAQAIRRAERLLRRVERTGRLNVLARIDQQIGSFIDSGGRSVARLDDLKSDVLFPATSVLEGGGLAEPGRRLLTYRRAIAGHDDLWVNHLNGDRTAFAELAANPDYERFFHSTDPETGVPSENSVLRDREHRRMLVDANRRRVTFLPRLPVRADLTDAGLLPGFEYTLDVQRPLRGARRLLTALGDAAQLARGGRATVAVSADTPLAEPTAGSPGPRLVNVTPPDGELFVDGTTDWEDPDDFHLVAEPERRRFVVRLRFAAPLDPRTVNRNTFQLFRVTRDVGTNEEADVFEHVECDLNLVQSRLGQVRVDMLPNVGNIDPQSRYEVRVLQPVRGLDGATLRQPFKSEFTTY